MNTEKRPKSVESARPTTGKEIRILTGVHAGARLALQPGPQCLGKDNDAKIRISDWNTTPLWIDVDVDGRITRKTPGNEDGGWADECFGEFEPFRFGDIVIAFGETSARWPTDLELLETMLRPPEPKPDEIEAGANRPRRFGPKWGFALAGAILLGVSVTSARQIRSAEPEIIVNRPEQVSRLQNALETLGQPELRIVSERGMVTVKGLVMTLADLQHVMDSLDDIAPGRIQPEITVVDDVVENIKGSLHDSNLAVTYSGDGIFQVSGATPRAERGRAILDRIRTDLGANVRRLDVAIESTGDGFPSNTDAAIHAGDIHYADTSDGVKHFVEGTANLASR